MRVVWSQQQDGALYGLDAATGQTRALLQVGDSTRFATPALSGNALFVATRTGITATTIAPVRGRTPGPSRLVAGRIGVDGYVVPTFVVA